MSLSLTHYAAAPVTLDRTRTYAQHRPHGYGKPEGLWVSVDGEDDWAAWCRAESFCPDGLTHPHRVTLVESPHVLLITDGLGLDSFHASWAVQTEREREMDRDYPGHLYGLTQAQLRTQWPIDWAAVARAYDGILIAPYLWNSRMSGPSFYYGWDCASGCLWNLGAIASFSPLDTAMSYTSSIGSDQGGPQ